MWTWGGADGVLLLLRRSEDPRCSRMKDGTARKNDTPTAHEEGGVAARREEAEREKRAGTRGGSGRPREEHSRRRRGRRTGRERKTEKERKERGGKNEGCHSGEGGRGERG